MSENIDFLFRVLDQQLALTVGLDVPEITTLAKELAFYDAILVASLIEPLGNAQDNINFRTRVKTRRENTLILYMKFVNENT